MNVLLLKSATSKDVCSHHFYLTGIKDSRQWNKIEKEKKL